MNASLISDNGFCRRVSAALLICLVITGCTPRASGPEDSPGFGAAMLLEQLAESDAEETRVPPSAEAHYNFLRAELALEMENVEEALEYYEKAAELEQGPAPFLRRRLAQLYVRAGKLEDALAQLDKARQGNADDLEVVKLRAGILASVKRTDEAIAAYRELIQLDPEQQDSYIILSSLYAQNKDPVAAVNVLKELVSKVPDSLFGYYYLARMLEATGDAAEAEKYYRKAIEVEPASESIQIDFARALATQGREEQALEVTTRILKSNPKSLAARQLKGQILWEGKKLDEALRTLEELREMEDDPAETRLKIALIKLERKDFAGAEEQLNLILAGHPGNPTARYFLASAYVGMNRLNDALSELAKIESGERMYVEARTLSAYLLRQEKRFAEAAEELSAALKVKENDIGLLVYLATVQREAEQFTEAIETMQQVLAQEPDDDRHLFTLGVLYHDAGDEAKAEEVMRRVIAANPSNANALNYLGYTLAEGNRSLPEAEELIKRALTLDASNGYFLDSLGWVYFKMGRYQDALVQLERAVKFSPDDAVILEHLGEVLLKLGQRERALKTFEQALRFAPESDDKGVAERLELRVEELRAVKSGQNM